jgi:hypothetical protein
VARARFFAEGLHCTAEVRRSGAGEVKRRAGAPFPSLPMPDTPDTIPVQARGTELTAQTFGDILWES